MSKITGGCLCGKVRYESESEVLRAYHCHCKDCQKLSGSGHLSLLAISESNFNITGTLTSFEKTTDSGSKVLLKFCPFCGSNILGSPEQMPGVIAIAAGSLDDTSIFAPTIEIFTESAPTWDTLNPETIKFSGLPK